MVDKKLKKNLKSHKTCENNCNKRAASVGLGRPVGHGRQKKRKNMIGGGNVQESKKEHGNKELDASKSFVIVVSVLPPPPGITRFRRFINPARVECDRSRCTYDTHDSSRCIISLSSGRLELTVSKSKILE